MSETARKAARLLTVGFTGNHLSDDLKILIDAGISGVVLFSRNIGTPEEVAALIREIKEYAGHPIFIAIDQEGGSFSRLKAGFTALPPMRSVGATRDPELAYQVGHVIGRELRAVGVDLNLAPVLDVDTNPQNPIIGIRSLSRDARVVAELGAALIRGIQSQGVAACGKHFPGHGDTSQDSNLELPRLPHRMDRLDAVDLPPFEAAVKASVAAISTAHVIFSPIDDHYPASMSRPVLHGLLRARMGFRGVVFADDVEMRAIANHFGFEEAAVRGINASIDNFICSHTAAVAHSMIEAIVRGIESDAVLPERLESANRRITALLFRYAKPPVEPNLAVLRSLEHEAVIDRVLARASSPSWDAPDDPLLIADGVREQRRAD